MEGVAIYKTGRVGGSHQDFDRGLLSLSLSHSVCGILLQWPELTKTVTLCKMWKLRPEVTCCPLAAEEEVGGHGTDVAGAPGTILHTNAGVSVHLESARLGRATRGLPFGPVLRALTRRRCLFTHRDAINP